MKALAALLGLFVSAASLAQPKLAEPSYPYMLIGISDVAVWRLRTDRYERKGDVITAWVYVETFKPASLPFRDGRKIPYSTVITQYAIDCASKRYAMGDAVYQAKNGEPVYNAPGYLFDFKTPIPDTFGDGIVLRACDTAAGLR